MTPTIPEINDLLYSTDTWSEIKPGLFNVHSLQDNTEFKDHVISEKDLSLRHPKLPLILRALINLNLAKRSQESTTGDQVTATLQYHEQGAYSLLTSSGYSCLFERLLTFNFVDDSKTKVEVTGYVYLLENVDLPPETVTVATDTAYFECNVDAVYMNEKFNGWDKRFSIAKNLDLDFDELVAYIFSETLTLPAEDNDLTFE